jgi:hypothetical protein
MEEGGEISFPSFWVGAILCAKIFELKLYLNDAQTQKRSDLEILMYTYFQYRNKAEQIKEG